MKMEEIAKRIVEGATHWIGQEEVSGNQGFKQEDFEQRMIDVGWKRKQAWCAYFCELVWKLAFIQDQDIVHELDKLFSASAVQTWRNFQRSMFEVNRIPSPGALAIWQKYKKGVPHWSGHMAIVVTADTQRLVTIDGNTNDFGGREGYIVAKRSRFLKFDNRQGLRLLGFIHPDSDKKTRDS